MCSAGLSNELVIRKVKEHVLTLQKQGKIAGLTKFKEYSRQYGDLTCIKFLTCEKEKAKDHDRGVTKVEEC